MSRVQLALNVTNLTETVSFSAALFATAPAKVRPRDAKFVVAGPPLELVLIEDPRVQPGSLNRLGVEVPTTRDAAEARRRLVAAGLGGAVEDEATCCDAVHDKVWVDGPDGEPWEVSTFLADAEMAATHAPSSGRGDRACRASRPAPVHPVASACC